MIATSSWFTQLDPVRYARIGISRGVPRAQSGYRRYPKLNPGPWFNSVANDEYRRRYYDEFSIRSTQAASSPSFTPWRTI